MDIHVPACAFIQRTWMSYINFKDGWFKNTQLSGDNCDLMFHQGYPRSRTITVDRYLFLAIMTWQWAGGRINIKISSYQYRKSYCGDKTILRPSYLHNGISFTDNMTYFNWIRALNPTPSSTDDTEVSTPRAELFWSNISICFSTMTLLKNTFRPFTLMINRYGWSKLHITKMQS